MDVTLLGMSNDVRPLQPEKAFLPMDVTLLGMFTDVRLLQSEYLQVVYYQLLVS